jgi:undecaprenyl diphosphate synthase
VKGDPLFLSIRFMTQRTSGSLQPLHVAMIMDGNGRWAQARGQARLMGHKEGAVAVRRVVEAAREMELGVLTLYAFSSDNWKRPPREVAALMRLFRRYLASETARCVQNGVRLCVIGRRDRLSPVLLRAIEAAETATADGERLLLRIAIDYSARDTLMRAVTLLSGAGALDRARFAAAHAQAMHSPAVPDVDLLIRTGGEQRLSDFLLWECAYAELLFDGCLWPDYDAARLRQALAEFRSRERRFGGLVRAAV